MEEQLKARLRAMAGLAALVGTRIWPLVRPQGSDLSALTFQVISTERGYTHDGAIGLTRSRVQFDSYGESYGDAKLVSRALIDGIEPEATVDGIRFVRAFLAGERDLSITDVAGGDKVFRNSLDFFVWWQPA